MEKKKILLVAISVGVFFALTIGAALLVFAPKDASTAPMAAARPIEAIDTGITVPPPALGPSVNKDSTPQPSSLDPVELVNATPGLRQAPEGTSRQGEDFYVGGNNGNNGGTGKSTETVITVTKPSTAAVPDAAPTGKATSNTSAEKAATTTTTAKDTPTTPAQTAPKPASATVTASVTTPAAKAAPAATAAQTQAKPAATQAKVYNDYWVQTGAFSTMARAEGVKDTLSSKGITSIIENREVEGKTVFRVRVGPYTSQNEANYWLSLIKSINGFEDSQVRQTQSLR
jgi:DedD protein